MTTSEPAGASATPKATRRRRTEERATGPGGSGRGAPADAPGGTRRKAASKSAKGPEGAPAPSPAAPPAIEEDGAWIQADAVEVHQGAIGRVDATDVAVTQGAIGAARGDRVSVEMGALGAALAGEVSISQGAAGTVIAQRARVEQSLVRTLIAQEVTFPRPSAVVFLVAQRVSGEVRVLLDWRGALALGTAFGLVAGLLRRGRRRA